MRWMGVLAVGTAFFAGSVAAQDEKPRPKDGPPRLDPARMLEQFDRNKDGSLDRDEAPERVRPRFDQMDVDKDGKLSKAELERFAGKRPGGPDPVAAQPDALFRLLDADGDGKLSKEELANAPKLLDRLDRNKNGTIEPGELAGPAPKGGRPGEVVTPAAKGERPPDRLKVGDPAPDFALPLVKGKGEVTLSASRGKKPVVLIFASYT